MQLISLGIDAGRLTAKGYGETQLIADNATPEGRTNTQRVEFPDLSDLVRSNYENININN